MQKESGRWCAGEACETWGRFPHSLSSRHPGWADLGYTELAIPPAHELVNYLENVEEVGGGRPWSPQARQVRETQRE